MRPGKTENVHTKVRTRDALGRRMRRSAWRHAAAPPAISAAATAPTAHAFTAPSAASRAWATTHAASTATPTHANAEAEAARVPGMAARSRSCSIVADIPARATPVEAACENRGDGKVDIHPKREPSRTAVHTPEQTKRRRPRAREELATVPRQINMTAWPSREPLMREKGVKRWPKGRSRNCTKMLGHVNASAAKYENSGHPYASEKNGMRFKATLKEKRRPIPRRRQDAQTPGGAAGWTASSVDAVEGVASCWTASADSANGRSLEEDI